MTSVKWEKRSGKEETPEMKERQIINKRIFGWGMVIAVLITLPLLTLGLSYSDFLRGFEGGLMVWLLALMFLVRLLNTKKITQSLLNGFLVGEVVIVIPILSTCWILIVLGQEEFIAGSFGFLVSLVSFSVANAILSKAIHRLKNELYKLQLAKQGFKPIEELQKNPQLHE